MTPAQAIFKTTVTMIISASEVAMSDILLALVYIERAKRRLIVVSGTWAYECLFAGALVLANKVFPVSFA